MLCTMVQTAVEDRQMQCRIEGVLGVPQHPGPKFLEPAIGGSGKLVIGLYGARNWHSIRSGTSLSAALVRCKRLSCNSW